MRRFLPLLLATATWALPAIANAQPHKLDTPVDSPMWWTLTDDLTPAQVKQLYNDRSATLERYDAAVEAGLEPTPAEEGSESRECLKFYFHPALTPELEPMWFVFRTFSTLYVPGELAVEEHAQTAPLDLHRKFGVSPSGVETILRAAADTVTKHDSLAAEVGPKSKALTLLLMELREDPIRAAAAPPEWRLGDAINEKDYTTVAAAVGRPVAEIRELVDAWADWDALGALVADQLPGLREELSESDWSGFRRYLLEIVLPRQGAIKDTDSYCEERR